MFGKMAGYSLKKIIDSFSSKDANEIKQESLKMYTTKELIKELKRRGINLPKKYR